MLESDLGVTRETIMAPTVGLNSYIRVIDTTGKKYVPSEWRTIILSDNENPPINHACFNLVDDLLKSQVGAHEIGHSFGLKHQYFTLDEWKKLKTPHIMAEVRLADGRVATERHRLKVTLYNHRKIFESDYFRKMYSGSTQLGRQNNIILAIYLRYMYDKHGNFVHTNFRKP